MDDADSISQLTKKCSTCKQEKPIDCFSKKKRLKDGLNSQCKDCQSEYYKRFYSENRDNQLERFKKYREENPPSPEKKEEMRLKARAYWDANRDEIAARRRDRYWDETSGIRERNIERCREWVSQNLDRIYSNMRLYYKANAELIKEKVRRYEQLNPEKCKALNRVKVNRRRARLNTSCVHYTRHDVERIYKNQRGKCANCSCQLLDSYHIDHRVPVAKGGDNSPGNIELLCKKCNLKKAAKLPHEFAQENGRLI